MFILITPMLRFVNTQAIYPETTTRRIFSVDLGWVGQMGVDASEHREGEGRNSTTPIVIMEFAVSEL